MKRFVLVLCFTATLMRPAFSETATPQAAPAQTQADNAEERRREAERVAAEKAREAERKKESEARLEEFRKLRPPTMAERVADHKRLLPDFLKKVGKFEADSKNIAAYKSRNLDQSAIKSIGKKAKALA